MDSSDSEDSWYIGTDEWGIEESDVGKIDDGSDSGDGIEPYLFEPYTSETGKNSE